MTIPYERTCSLLDTKSFLLKLVDTKRQPRVPASVRKHAAYLLQHYPSYADVELAHKALPEVYGPVPPLSRLVGGEQTVGVIEAASERKE